VSKVFAFLLTWSSARLCGLILLAACMPAADPVCLQLKHYKKTTIEWPDEAEHPDGFYWVDSANSCGRDLGRLYVVVSFWDAQQRHLADSFWSFDIDTGRRDTNRFTAPRMVRPYRSITVLKITNDLMEAICLTDRSRCSVASPSHTQPPTQ
jgi:hypothetical protein